MTFSVTLSNGMTYGVVAADEWQARQLAIRANVAAGLSPAWVKHVNAGKDLTWDLPRGKMQA